jgi:hypothetical protein
MLVSASGLLAFFGIAQPLVNRYGDTRALAQESRRAAETLAPWPEWQVLLYDTKPQMGFYLDPDTRARRLFAPEELDRALKEHPRSIVVTYARHQGIVEARMPGAAVLRERSILPGSLGKPKPTPEAQVVFIPTVPAGGRVPPR